MPPTQLNRHAAVDTKLGPDRLLLKSFSGREELGRLFDYHMVLLDAQQDVDPDDLVGTNITLRLQLENGNTRYFNGYISSLAFLGYEAGAGVYHAEVVPWLWLLTRCSDCRIWQEKTVKQILEEVFAAQGFTDFKFELRRSYKPRVFCAQYNETAFNFVSRLMEHEGIYYYWKHENGKHTMVIVDDMAVHVPHPERSDIEWRQRSGILEDGYLYDLCVQKTVSPGAFAHSDYNFKKPKDELRKKKEKEKKHAAAKFELFEFPGSYREGADGEALAEVRLQEAQTDHESMSAMVSARAVSCGYNLNLKKAERADQQRGYLITSTNITIQQDAYTSGQGATEDRYECRITAIPKTSVYRPRRVTPKPFMHGPQTGLVVGPSGEEIYTDEHGRIKVHFYWDRRSTANEKSSKWVRVCQPAAGGGYGFTSIPRIGQEVIVDFIEGDPDRPIVTGCVYNGTNKPPYSLPAEKTKSVWKTNSSKGGGGYNEIRMEDSKDSEQIYIHSQKDLDIRVDNDTRMLTGHDCDVTVGNDCTTTIAANAATTIGTNHAHSVGSNQSVTIGADEMVEVGGSSSKDVTGDVFVKAGMNLHLEAGMNVYIKAGMNVVLEAGMGITVKGSGGHVTVSPAGVAIVGTPMVLINSGGAAMPPTKVAKKKPEKAKKAKEAKSSGAGQVECAGSQGHASNPQTWSRTTVHDHAAQNGAPFYGGSAGGAGGGSNSGAGAPASAGSGSGAGGGSGGQSSSGGAGGSGGGAGGAAPPGGGAGGGAGGGGPQSGAPSSGGGGSGYSGGGGSSGGGGASGSY